MCSVGMDGVELELVCPCGYELRGDRGSAQAACAVVTDFAACVGCWAMYFTPVQRPDPPEIRPGHETRGLGGPQAKPDTDAALKRDAATRPGTIASQVDQADADGAGWLRFARVLWPRRPVVAVERDSRLGP